MAVGAPTETEGADYLPFRLNPNVMAYSEAVLQKINESMRVALDIAERTAIQRALVQEHYRRNPPQAVEYPPGYIDFDCIIVVPELTRRNRRYRPYQRINAARRQYIRAVIRKHSATMTYTAIAGMLNVSVTTVQRHARRIADWRTSQE